MREDAGQTPLRAIKWIACVILVAAILVCAQGWLFGALLSAGDQHLSKKEIVRVVHDHADQLERAAKAMQELALGRGYIRLDKSSRLYYDDGDSTRYLENTDIAAALAIVGIDGIRAEDTAVEFCCGATGFVVEGTYYGFYYSETDNIHSIWCSMQPLKPFQNGWKFTGTEGDDNTYYTERIQGHFFYYEAHY